MHLEQIVTTNIFTYFRSDEIAFVRLELSGQMRKMRQRTLMVNIKIQVLTWVLEFIAGNSVAVIFLSERKDALKWVPLMDALMLYILIPSTYVINRDITKQIIILNDWYRGIKSVFGFGGKVGPV